MSEPDPIYQYPLQIIHEVPRGQISRFHTGTITLRAEGIVLEGITDNDDDEVMVVVNVITNILDNGKFKKKLTREANYWEHIEAIIAISDRVAVFLDLSHSAFHERLLS